MTRFKWISVLLILLMIVAGTTGGQNAQGISSVAQRLENAIKLKKTGWVLEKNENRWGYVEHIWNRAAADNDRLIVSISYFDTREQAVSAMNDLIRHTSIPPNAFVSGLGEANVMWATKSTDPIEIANLIFVRHKTMITIHAGSRSVCEGFASIMDAELIGIDNVN